MRRRFKSPGRMIPTVLQAAAITVAEMFQAAQRITAVTQEPLLPYAEAGLMHLLNPPWVGHVHWAGPATRQLASRLHERLAPPRGRRPRYPGPVEAIVPAPRERFPVAVPVSVGLGAAATLLALYVLIVTLAQGWQSAVELLRQDAPLVAPITLVFGFQAALFTHLKLLVRSRVRGAGALTGASGGTSTAAMVACCAHRVADLLPILGLSAAAGFLAAWKVPFMIVGLVFSLAGAAFILRRIIRYRQLHGPTRNRA